MYGKRLLFVALLLLTVHTVQAQEPDPLEDYFFPPELVMQHQRAINLTDAQKQTIKEATLEAQALFADIQWQLLDEMEALQALVKKERVNETALLDQLDEILALEHQIKRGQLKLVVRIKNTLTPEQQEQLQDLKLWGPKEQF
ncbi:MAG: Spy/CpxP family protein refolding chaperone [Rhodothermales bacterium]